MPNALSMFAGPQNLSMQERAISVVVGLGLAAAATKPRPNPLLNVAALLGGTYLAVRGATGRCPVKKTLLALASAEPVVAEVPAKRSRRVARR